MKTTADLLLASNSYIVNYMDSSNDIIVHLKELIQKHYINGVLDNSTDSIPAVFEYLIDEMDNCIEGGIFITYNKGVIEITIKHIGITCNKCSGEGLIIDQCYECDGYDEDCVVCHGTDEVEDTCLECGGNGRLTDDWSILSSEFDIDLPEVVVYKTMDLNQIELF